MDEIDMKATWRKFGAGNGLSDAELDALIAQAEMGVKFLEDRGETGGVLFRLLCDRESLRRFKIHRQERG